MNREICEMLLDHLILSIIFQYKDMLINYCGMNNKTNTSVLNCQGISDHTDKHVLI